MFVDDFNNFIPYLVFLLNWSVLLNNNRSRVFISTIDQSDARANYKLYADISH
jgi:hypothetical protein